MSTGTGYDNNYVGPFPPAVFVLIVIIAAEAAVVVGYAVSRFYNGPDPERNFTSPSQAQDDYMRELRNRNYDHILAQISGGRRQHGGPTFHAPEGRDSESSMEY